jgi:hypothetical protein
MSRPKPNIILEDTSKTRYQADQILESTGVWAVFYDNKPINFKTAHLMIASASKYRKVSFSNPGHAIGLAKRLNKQFKTDKFTVVLMSVGDTVWKPSDEQ